MEENVLSDFQTFEEFPDKLLKIDNNCNIFALTLNDDSTYIVREKLDNIYTFDKKGSRAVCLKKEYYDILNGSKITETESWYYLDKKYRLNKKKNNILVLSPFSKLFEANKKSKETFYLDMNQALYVIGQENVNRNIEAISKQKVLEK